MNYGENSKRRVCFVGDDETREYIYYLTTILVEKNKVNEIDASNVCIDGVMYNYNEYKNNQSIHSINQYSVFMGIGDEARTISKNLVKRYDRFGFSISYSGRNAVIAKTDGIDREMQDDEYRVMHSFAVKQIEKIRSKHGCIFDFTELEENLLETFQLDFLKNPVNFLNPFNRFDRNMHIKNQQYRLAVILFAFDYIDDFLNI